MKHHVIFPAMLLLVTAAVTQVWSQDERFERTRSTLTVNGQSEVFAAPDRAMVRLGAEAQGETAQVAQSQVNAVMQRALQQIRAVGIDERRIQTTGLHLFPVYDRQRPGEELAPRIISYRASNTIQVDVENLQLVGKVIDAGIGAGANRLQGIDFNLRNDLPARTQALQQAVAEARTKAQALATALNVRLDGIDQVQESGVHVMPPPRPYGDMMMRAEAVSTPIQPGEMRVQASVILRYRIAPN